MRLLTHILCAEQHGFVHGRSTCTNLLESKGWTQNIQDRCTGRTIIIYVDFSKAFDVVQHDKLFVKLQAYGIDGTLLEWIMDLLTNPTFQTRINDLLSAVSNLLSGIIQGSVIGPLMFLIYINHLIELLNNYKIPVNLFAYHVKLYVKMVNTADAVELQNMLSALVLF